MNDRGDWFLSYTGNKVYPLDLLPNDIDIADIAHSLSNICRFGGHCNEFYSVAQHCVLMTLHVDTQFKKVSLLHDATEAYCGDMVRPLKHQIPQYKEIEASIWRSICTRFNLPIDLPQEVLIADARILLSEKRDLVNNNGHVWSYPQCAFPDIEPYPELIIPWSPYHSRREFLSFYERFCV